MSYGFQNPGGHETLAIAMNRLQGKSNSGEGGETPERMQASSRTEPTATRLLSRLPPAPHSAYARNTGSAPRELRLRWLRAPSPARADTLPAGRYIPDSSDQKLNPRREPYFPRLTRYIQLRTLPSLLIRPEKRQHGRKNQR